jgi:hypothetical protein
MWAPRTRRITSYTITVIYIAFMVSSLALNCSCCAVEPKVANRYAAHHCAHMSSESSADAHNHLDVADCASITNCCHDCFPSSAEGKYPHIANPQQKTAPQGLSVATLPKLFTPLVETVFKAGDPPVPTYPNFQIARLRTVFLLI